MILAAIFDASNQTNLGNTGVGNNNGLSDQTFWYLVKASITGHTFVTYHHHTAPKKTVIDELHTAVESLKGEALNTCTATQKPVLPDLGFFFSNLTTAFWGEPMKTSWHVLNVLNHSLCRPI